MMQHMHSDEVVRIGSDCHNDHPWSHISPQRFERFSSVSSVSRAFRERFSDGRRADFGGSYFDLVLILTTILIGSIDESLLRSTINS